MRAGLRPGDRLPTQRELSRDLGVSGGVVREALKELQAEQVVDVRHGGGMFVKPYGPDLAAAALSPAADPRQAQEDLLHARAAIEQAAAAQACQRAGPADLEALQGAVDAMERAAAGRDYRPDLDLLFHRLLVRSAHNPFLLRFGAVIAEYFSQKERAPARALRAGAAGAAMALVAERHRQLLAVLRRRDAVDAAAAVRVHIVDELWRQPGSSTALG